jgi:hypothetical protein
VVAPDGGFDKASTMSLQGLIKYKWTPNGTLQKTKGRIVLRGDSIPMDTYLAMDISGRK